MVRRLGTSRQRSIVTVSSAAAILGGIAVLYLTSSPASSIFTQTAERTAAVLSAGTRDAAPGSMLGPAGFERETDAGQAKLILARLGASAIWSYDPSSQTFQSLAAAIPEAGSTLYVRPETEQLVDAMEQPTLVAASIPVTTAPPYANGGLRSNFERLDRSYVPRRHRWYWSIANGGSSGGSPAPVTTTAVDDQDITVVGTTTTTTTVPSTTTTTTTVPSTTTTVAPTTTSTTQPPTTTAPTTTTTTTTIPPRQVVLSTTTTTTTLPRRVTTTTTSTTTTTTTTPPTTTTTAPTSLGAALSPPSGFSASQLEFDDSASGSAINPAFWNTYITSNAAQGQPWNSNGAGGSSPAGSPNYDAEYDLPGQVSEGNGVIDIRATETPTEGVDGYSMVFPWASGTLSTYGHFQFDGGYVQIEAKMPAGSGMWPGLWMLPGPGADDGDNYEIDLFEGGADDGGAGTLSSDMYSWHLHTPYGTVGADTNTNVNLTTSFNTYGLSWVPGQSITWYLNGNVVGQVTSAEASIPDEPMELIMNLQVANSSASNWHSVYNSSTPVVDDMLISGVQVYS